MTTQLPKPLDTPPPLAKGDLLSLVAPASSPDRGAFEAARAALEGAGWATRVYRDVCEPHGYLSGTDAQRAEELNQAFADPDSRAVLAVRGGYGVGRILDRIDYSLLRERPKWVCGYSDITALHAAIQSECELVSLHGPNLMAGLGDLEESSRAEREAFLAIARGALSSGDSLCSTVAKNTMTPVVPGKAAGRLVGGNLAVLTASVGTPYEPDFERGILLIEDTGEVPYRVDRLLTQLRHSEILKRLSGVVCGYFSDCDPGPGRGPQAPELLEEMLAPLEIPVLRGFPSGHEHPNLPLPLGALVELDAEACDLRLL